MNTLEAIYQSIPTFVWGLIFGAPFIMGLINVLKKVLGVKSTLVIHTINVTLSFLLIAIPQYVLNDPHSLKWLGTHAAVVFTAVNFVYAGVKVLSPFFKEVEAYETKKANRLAAEATAPQDVTIAHTSSTDSAGTFAATATNIPVTVASSPAAATDATVFEG